MNSNILLTLVDVTIYKIEGHKYEEYPTLLFFKKGANPETIAFEMNHSVGELIYFTK